LQQQKPSLTGGLRRAIWHGKDEEGSIWLVDRKKDVIISGGENLYPVQIERIFFRPIRPSKTLRLSACRMNDLVRIASAIIELKPEQQATEMTSTTFVKRLPRYKRPRKINFCTGSSQSKPARSRSLACAKSMAQNISLPARMMRCVVILAVGTARAIGGDGHAKAAAFRQRGNRAGGMGGGR
jgi:acyl-CoA synthetase (AMP-forming)/AMP-acid ligase II